MTLSKYSIGIGDRFAHQGKAQLEAIIKAKQKGVHITPVWNKSFREHEIIKTKPVSVRQEADAAVKACGWNESYFVDADHVGMKTVDLFIDSSDFFTLDVADFIGKSTDKSKIESFIQKYKKYVGTLNIPGIDEPLSISDQQIHEIADNYLFGVEEAGRIYRHVSETKSGDDVAFEVSMDETAEPQTPIELLFILAAISEEGIPAKTIAPKFTGRFNKGIDYVGDIQQFTKEFEQDLAVIQFAVKEFSLPTELKLSVHSGSDKFAIYEPIRKAIKKFDAGLHLKTAGTTWLEELIGLAQAGGSGLILAQDIYRVAYSKFDELCKPYASVIDIIQGQLPKPDRVDMWNSDDYTSALRHDQTNPAYNKHFRQLLHVGYKVAVEKENKYFEALKEYKNSIAKNVTENIYDRHIKPLFLDK
jgi:hypothetical protein